MYSNQRTVANGRWFLQHICTLFRIRILFFQSKLNILIFLPTLGCKLIVLYLLLKYSYNFENFSFDINPYKSTSHEQNV